MLYRENGTAREARVGVDDYTALTKAWLDDRYRTPAAGPYVPHQPIYGFAHARRTGILWDYTRIHRVLETLSHVDFRTLLEVGAAEGLTSALSARLLRADVEVTDLSSEACLRASEMFGLKATPADVHSLPHADLSFDVVLCTETLEHVTDTERAIRELLRVARSAVIVSVPEEPPSEIHGNRERGEPHSHIHAFDAHSFDHLELEGIVVRRQRIMSPFLRIPLALLEGRKPSEATEARLPRSVRSAYGLVRPYLRYIPGLGLTKLMMSADSLVCGITNPHSGLLFVLLKDERKWLERPSTRIRPGRILGFSATREHQ